MNELHKPVMLKEVLDYLAVKESRIYVDGTFGTGGHSRAILEKLKTGKLIAFEWDKKEFELAQKENSFSTPNFLLINDNFANLEKHLLMLNISQVDGFLFDLGLSSYHLADQERGFSYRSDSPLDMRINQTNKISAEYIINNYPTEKLADIFYHYGEESKARLIARKIGYWRKKEKITTTQQLVGIIAACFSKKGKKHPARKVFQALRIFINNELENITQALETALKYLAVEGKIAVISYHSLEDRIVKQKFKNYSSFGNYQTITKKPLTPTQKEIDNNHRARSAKMRIIIKIN